MKTIKKLLLLFAVALMATTTYAQEASAALQVDATDKGFLMPRVTTAQRTAIASPAAGLQVYDTTTNSLWYYDGTAWAEASGGTGKFVDGDTATNAVYTGGGVIIGATTVPETPNGLRVIGTNTHSNLYSLNTMANASNAGGIIKLLQRGDGTTFVSEDDRLGAAIFGANDGADDNVNSASVGGYADGNWATADYPSRLEFKVTPIGSQWRSTAMTIKNDGKVGIGTDAPTHKLEVAVDESSGSNGAYIAVTDPAADIFSPNETVIGIGDGTSSSGRFTPTLSMKPNGHANTLSLIATEIREPHDIIGSSNFPVMRFRVHKESTDGTVDSPIDTRDLFRWTNLADDVMVLDASGNLGIGVAEPETKVNIASGQAFQVGLSSGSVSSQLTNNSVNFFRASSQSYINQSGVGSKLYIRTSNTAANDTNAMIIEATGDISVGAGSTPDAKLDVAGYIKVGSADTTGDAAPAAGMIRFNSTTSKFQGYDGSTWVDLH